MLKQSCRLKQDYIVKTYTYTAFRKNWNDPAYTYILHHSLYMTKNPCEEQQHQELFKSVNSAGKL